MSETKFHTLDTLVLSNFINILSDKSYYLLILSGTPMEIELEEYFKSLYEEYNFYLRDDTDEIYWLRKHLLCLESEYNFLISSIFILKHRIDEEILKELKLYAPEITFDITNREILLQQIWLIESLPRIWLADIDQTKQELSEALKSISSNSKISIRESFANMIVTISTQIKFHLDKNKITVREFISYMQLAKQAREQFNLLRLKQNNSDYAG